jgi:hypothetical protein
MFLQDLKNNQMMKIPDMTNAAIGSFGTALATYSGENHLALAIAVCTLIIVIPKAIFNIYKFYAWLVTRVRKKLKLNNPED